MQWERIYSLSCLDEVLNHLWNVVVKQFNDVLKQETSRYKKVFWGIVGAVNGGRDDSTFGHTHLLLANQQELLGHELFAQFVRLSLTVVHLVFYFVHVC